jgi:hypothetical protein
LIKRRDEIKAWLRKAIDESDATIREEFRLKREQAASEKRLAQRIACIDILAA